MINIYSIKSHEVPFIAHWLEQRGMETNLSKLPENGILVCHSDRPVAAGFIRKCEGNFAIFDSMVTNPQVHGSIRDESMDALFEGLIALAKDLNISKIIGFTIDENTLVRSQKFGFERTPYALMSIDMDKKKV
jgi:hypothetical protein